ncbi:ATP-grasp fold amidoligase family protein [Paracoccus albus]|uniref:ATP-grasp fold amidoligase family protein n=1 Tax=Paracoccus albus TaxID=3017784 RepID=UPI0022F0562D|nr:ATP-grasp fold amidoligase family protein [Paracoccus albus]WBU59436.1 ATP-grasp fold amidoligase family protein [Paracoccus albus]
MRVVERFTDFIQAHIEKTDSHRISIDKEETRRIAAAAGARLPQLYQLARSPNEVDFANLPNAFVIKPTHLCSKKGVFVLFRVRDRFLDLFSMKLLSETEVIAELTRAIGTQLSSVMVEEFVTGENGQVEIPYDYKLYTFDSGVELIIQFNRNTAPDEICFFNGQFEPLGTDIVRVNENYAIPGRPIVPKQAEQLLMVAQSVQKEIDRPFISVDCYATAADVIVGELTPGPGGPYYDGLFRFSPTLDWQLGGYQIDGYRKRGWDIPMVAGFPPSRIRDSLFLSDQKQ